MKQHSPHKRFNGSGNGMYIVHTNDSTDLAMECESSECVIAMLSGTEYLIPWISYSS
jgi:hypothetical protein